jgi:hypothetical protein
MITFAIILIIVSFLGVVGLSCLLWFNRPKKPRSIKKVNEEFSRDMRETQVLDESMMTTELSNEDLIKLDKIKK